MRLAGVVAAALAAAALLAAPAVAEWTSAVRIGAGSAPVIAFGPTGDAALAFQDSAGSTYLARRPAGGQVSAATQATAATSVPGTLQSVVLPAGGSTVLLFGPATSGGSAVVKPPGSAAFGPAQQLVAAGGGGEAPTTPSVALVATVRGEVIAVAEDENATVYTAVLPRAGSAFGSEKQLPDFQGTLDLSAATDASGGVFVAGDLGEVAYRPPAGDFGSAPPARCGRDSCFFQFGELGIAAGGDGYAALATVSGSHVAVRVGREGRFGRAHVLAPTPHGAYIQLLGAPVVGNQASVTVAWQECPFPPGDPQGERGCSIAAARGNLHGSFGRAQTLARTPRRANAQVSGLVGDRTVAVQRCAPRRRCSISVALGNRHGGFATPQRITTDGRLQLLSGDARGDQLILWTTKDRILYGAVRPADAAHFGRAHRLSAAGVAFDANTGALGVTGAFGPRGEAIVGWELAAGATMAAVYRDPTRGPPALDPPRSAR